MDFVALARSYAGCSVTTERDRYLDLVGPYESGAMREYMAAPKTSGCALVVRGLWRIAGVKHARLAPPYHFGMAVADVDAIALSFSARELYHGELAAEWRPEPGDVVRVGGGTDGGGFEHVYVTAERDGDELVSIDGGQRDEHGNQCIREKRRIWTVDEHGAIWDRGFLASDPGGGSRRRVRAIYRAMQMPFVLPCGG
jgi:hypothetical protein